MLHSKVVLLVGALAITGAVSASNDGCGGLPNHSQLSSALRSVIGGNGGLDFPMWGAVVNRAGEVCAVAKTGDAWPGSRVIAAQKANTANAFSSSSLALSTANLYSAVQPGGSLFGLQESNPVNPLVAYRGDYKDFGSAKDPMVGFRIGGVNVFGGGLALYQGSDVVGAIGVSGDTSCADHNIAWRLRRALGFGTVVGGVAGGTDNIIYDIDARGSSAGDGVSSGKSVSGFGHPKCDANSVAPNGQQ